MKSVRPYSFGASGVFRLGFIDHNKVKILSYRIPHIKTFAYFCSFSSSLFYSGPSYSTTGMPKLWPTGRIAAPLMFLCGPATAHLIF